MVHLRFIDFFAGIGGISLGLERAGHKCVGQVEIHDYCTKVLEKHWPDVPRWRDIRDLTGEELPEADLWTAGFPCQDISQANKFASGLSGPRTGLFWEFARLAAAVQPRQCLLENSPMLVSRGYDRVKATMETMGYAVECWGIPAYIFGASHRRLRAFVLADLDGMGSIEKLRKAATTLFDADRHSAMAEQTRLKFILRPDADPCFRVGCERKGMDAPVFCRSVHGIPRRMERCRALGNAVVPQVAEYIGNLLMFAGHSETSQ